MSKWKIGEIFSFIRNGASIKQGIVDGGYPITRIETIANSKVDRNKMGYAGISNISKYYNYVLQTGDILMSHINSDKHLGKTAYYEQKDDETIIHGMNLLCLRPIKTLINNKYAYYFFQSSAFKYQIPNITKKSVNQASFTVTALKEMTLHLPPLEIQKQIAKTLDAAAELLSMRKQQLVELDNLIKSTFYDMFGDPVANEKGWNVKTLKDVCNKITDGTHNSPDNFNEGQYKYITAKNIKKDGFDLNNLTYISEVNHKVIYNRCNPQFVDVLYIKDGVTTGIAQINTLHEEFSMLSSVALLKQNRKMINAYYLREVLNNEAMYNNIRRNMGGAAITRLTINKIEMIQIPIPPLFLQTQFAEIVTKVEEQKTFVKKAINETLYMFNSLMSEYFE